MLMNRFNHGREKLLLIVGLVLSATITGTWALRASASAAQEDMHDTGDRQLWPRGMWRIGRGTRHQGAGCTEGGRGRPGGGGGRSGCGEGGKGSGGTPPPAASPEDDDLGVRFNKIVLDDGTSLPRQLEPDDYPLTGEVAAMVRDSSAVSVVLEEDCTDCGDTPFATLVESVGGYPSHASSDPSSPFWAEFRELLQVQKKRLNSAPATDVLPLANVWDGYTIEEVAEAVHNEFPGRHHVTLIKYLLGQGAEIDRDIIPSHCKIDFLRQVVMMADMNTWTIATVGPPNFGLKWDAGRARPEEVAWKIAQGELRQEHGVPADIVECIDELELKSPEEFTAYPEGSPGHPSWPAMHSAASAGSLWIPLVLLNPTRDQVCQTQLLDYDIAYGRTVAAVHYPSDNIAGLTLGQEYLAQVLPDYLSARYGSDPDIVRNKIESLRFNWGDFLSSDCVYGWTPSLD